MALPAPGCLLPRSYYFVSTLYCEFPQLLPFPFFLRHICLLHCQLRDQESRSFHRELPIVSTFDTAFCCRCIRTDRLTRATILFPNIRDDGDRFVTPINPVASCSATVTKIYQHI
jgi:hypothetical protein